MLLVATNSLGFINVPQVRESGLTTARGWNDGYSQYPIVQKDITAPPEVVGAAAGGSVAAALLAAAKVPSALACAAVPAIVLAILGKDGRFQSSINSLVDSRNWFRIW